MESIILVLLEYKSFELCVETMSKNTIIESKAKGPRTRLMILGISERSKTDTMKDFQLRYENDVEVTNRKNK